MLENCKRVNPLLRTGTNQIERLLKALDPEYIQLDERSTADLIVFAEGYSRLLNYYNSNNLLAGTWLPFFSRDIAAVLAGLSKLPVSEFQKFGRNLQEFLSDDESRDVNVLGTHFRLLFHLPLLLLKDIGDYYEQIPRTHTLKPFIQKLLLREVADQLKYLVRYYRGAVESASPIFNDDALVVSDYNTDFDDTDKRIQLPRAVTERLSDTKKVKEIEFNQAFITTIESQGWAFLYNQAGADPTPYQDSPGSIYHQIYDALNYNLLSQAFEQLFQSIERMRLEAHKSLSGALADFGEHTPHYGLWLAFLRLFRFNQDHLNTLTRRHLDYYYKDVLQLCLRKAVPDRVHLLFELNKNLDEHLLRGGSTQFKAGKDSKGKEVSYKLDNDIVVNKAVISSLKSIHFVQCKKGSFELPYAAEMTDSRDGKGEDLPKEDPKWKPFGPTSGVPNARIGFALADKQLFLREGKREITVTLELSTSVADLGVNRYGFKAALTAEEDWLEISNSTKLKADIKSDQLVFTINLDGADPAVIPYDETIHGKGFAVKEPLLKIEFNFEKYQLWAKDYFKLLRDIDISDINLKVEVRDGRNVALQNEFGVLDTAKPFLPFGPAPEVNAPLLLGSSELFSKKLEKLVINIQYEKVLSYFGHYKRVIPSSYKARLQHLKMGAWQTMKSSGGDVLEKSLFADSGTGQVLKSSDLLAIEAAAQNVLSDHEMVLLRDHLGAIGKEILAGGGDANPSGGSTGNPSNPQQAVGSEIGTAGGFIQLNIGSDRVSIQFSKSELDSLSTWVDQELENQPYSSESSAGFLKFLLTQDFGHRAYVDEKTVKLIEKAKNSATLPLEPYTPKIISLTVDYWSDEAQPKHFFHLHPFGLRKPSTRSQLFPLFTNQGELYIGVKDLDPPQSLAMLFQTVDGSSNPLKGENSLSWHYLKDEQWQLLEERYVQDRTNNLTGSGIITLAVPEDADDDNTRMPTKLHWFRMAVVKDSDALNDLLSIDAQAASATFLDQNNAPDFLAAPLPAKTISKLKVSDSAVKKIEQPYASFGGKAVETSKHFYTRSSERLRHKDRAVTMWDYERLVLEHFPKVYKVKCINHTGYCRDTNDDIKAYCEIKPGHVMVVPVPYVKGKTAVNPLRPYTDKKTIVAIRDFLKKRISPFVKLEVVNPRFEAIAVDFKVAFKKGIADTEFYEDKLEKAIICYLSPWAYDEGAEISFGGQWHKSAIIDFVEEQTYVDYLKDFKMFHREDIESSGESWKLIDLEVVTATTARSILVSHDSHEIESISE